MRSVCCVCKKKEGRNGGEGDRGWLVFPHFFQRWLRRDFWEICLGGFFVDYERKKHVKGVC